MKIENSSLPGQASTELLVLVGFFIIFGLPLAFLFFSASSSELGKTSIAQAKISSRTIADEAGEIYLQGPGARKVISVNYPDGILGGSVENGLVVLTIDADGRRQDVIASTFANVSGSLAGKRTAGLQRINLTYVEVGDYVNIAYATN